MDPTSIDFGQPPENLVRESYQQGLLLQSEDEEVEMAPTTSMNGCHESRDLAAQNRSRSQVTLIPVDTPQVHRVRFDTADDAIFVIKVSLVCLSLGLAGLTISRLATSAQSDDQDNQDTLFNDYRTVTAFVLVIWNVFFHSFSNLALVGASDNSSFGEPCFKEFSHLFTFGRNITILQLPGDENYALGMEETKFQLS